MSSSSASLGRVLGRGLRRLALYLGPHVGAVLFGVLLAKGVATLASLGGSCSFLCHPTVNAAMGIVGGLLGAQLYRSEHPLPPSD